MKKGLISTQEIKIIFQKYAAYLLPAAVMVVLAVLTSMLMPQFLKIMPLREEIKKKESEADKMTEKIVALQGMNSHLLKSNVDLLTETLPDYKNVADVLLNLKVLCDEEKVVLNEVDVAPGLLATEAAKIQEVKFEAMVKGTLEALKKFLERINLLAPVMSIDSLKMTHNQDLWEMKFSFLTFTANKRISFQADTPLPDLSPESKKMAENLTEFESLYNRAVEVNAQATESAKTLERKSLFSSP